MEAWMLNNPGKTMTIYDIPGIVNVALPLATTVNNICNGFKCSGIVPYNRDIFPESDYAPSEVTDHRLHDSVVEAEEQVLSQTVESLIIHDADTERRPNSSPNYLTPERRMIFSPRRSLGIQGKENLDPDNRTAALNENILSFEGIQEAFDERNDASDLSWSSSWKEIVALNRARLPTIYSEADTHNREEFGEPICVETSESCDWQNLSAGQSSRLPLLNIETLEQVNLNYNDRSEVSLEELQTICARWNNTSEQTTSSAQNVMIIDLDSLLGEAEVDKRAKKDIVPAEPVTKRNLLNKRKTSELGRKKEQKRPPATCVLKPSMSNNSSTYTTPGPSSTVSSEVQKSGKKKLARKRSTPPPVPRTVTKATVVAVKESVDSSTPNLFTCDQSSKSGARRKENSCGQSTLASKKNREFREQELASFKPASEPSASTSSSYITPEKIRPYPQASTAITKRKGGRMKLHSAILTDSPERKAIVERKKNTEKRKSLSIATDNNTKKTKKQTPKGRKKKEPEYYCLVCNEPYSKSKVSWIQCIGCSMWAHITCTAGNADYHCHGCDTVDNQ